MCVCACEGCTPHAMAACRQMLPPHTAPGSRPTTPTHLGLTRQHGAALALQLLAPVCGTQVKLVERLLGGWGGVCGVGV
jgi:hypothetical protein